MCDATRAWREDMAAACQPHMRHSCLLSPACAHCDSKQSLVTGLSCLHGATCLMVSVMPKKWVLRIGNACCWLSMGHVREACCLHHQVPQPNVRMCIMAQSCTQQRPSMPRW